MHRNSLSSQKTEKVEVFWVLFHFQFASFFKFIAANLSLTQFLTWARPLYGVYLIACFSLASANTRSIFSFLKVYKNATVKISDSSNVYIEATCDLAPDNVLSIDVNNLPEFVTVSVVADGKTVAEYTEKNFNKLNMPDVITDMPSEAGMNSADNLYLAGVHVDQYRDPAVLPDSYWKEALNRNINHIPSLDEIILLNEEQKNKLLLYSKLLALLNLILSDAVIPFSRSGKNYTVISKAKSYIEKTMKSRLLLKILRKMCI